MRFHTGHAEHIRALPVEHRCVQRLWIGQHFVAVQGPELVVRAVPSVNVPMHPHDVVVAYRASLKVCVLRVATTGTTSAVILHLADQGAVRVLFPLAPLRIWALHPLLNVHRIHRDDVDEVGRAVHGVGPVGRRVKAEVLDGDQIHHRLIVRSDQLALGVLAHGIAPVYVRHASALHLRVL